MSSSARHSAILLIFLKAASRAPVRVRVCVMGRREGVKGWKGMEREGTRSESLKWFMFFNKLPFGSDHSHMQ